MELIENIVVFLQRNRFDIIMLQRKYGYWDVIIEKSGRIKLPSALLKALPEESRTNFWITRGFGKYIALWTDHAFQEQLAYLDALDENMIQNRIYRNALLKNLLMVECDMQNRFIIPRPLIEFYGIDRDVVLLLAKGKIEIWNQNHYNEQFDLDPEIFAQLNETISINHKKQTGNGEDSVS